MFVTLNPNQFLVFIHNFSSPLVKYVYGFTIEPARVPHQAGLPEREHFKKSLLISQIGSTRVNIQSQK